MTTKKITILYVGNDARYFLMHRLPLAAAARAAGYDVHAALPGWAEDERIIGEHDISFHRIALTRGGFKPLDDLATIFSLCKLYRALRPDIIHLHTIKPVIYGATCARLAGQRNIVCGITGLGYSYIGRGLRARIRRAVTTMAYRIALARSRARVIFQNKDDMALFISRAIVDRGRACLVRGSGVDLNAFRVRPMQEERRTVALVSRMLWDKGIGEYVDAARILRQRGVESRFLLVGDVDDANPKTVSRKQMMRWHESGVIEWAGWVDDMTQIYEGAHVVCLPSYREGVPRSLMEAAACGKPLVATDVPGCREIVRHGENGYLVPARNALLLADAIQKLVESPALRRQMGMRSRAIAEAEFSVEKVVQETLTVYREVLQ